MCNALGRKFFTGKGDREMISEMYRTFHEQAVEFETAMRGAARAGRIQAALSWWGQQIGEKTGFVLSVSLASCFLTDLWAARRRERENSWITGGSFGDATIVDVWAVGYDRLADNSNLGWFLEWRRVWADYEFLYN